MQLRIRKIVFCDNTMVDEKGLSACLKFAIETIKTELQQRLAFLKQNDKLDWGIDSNGDIKIKVKKEKTLDDLSGLISLPYETDAVEGLVSLVESGFTE